MSGRWIWMAWSALATLLIAVFSTASVAAEERLYLVRDGQPRIAIVRGTVDDFAAERLAQGLTPPGSAAITVREADGQPLPQVACTVLVGSAESNPLLGKVAAELRLDIAPDRLTDQGYLARWVRHQGRDWLILAGGGRDGAIHAVVDLLNWRVQHDGRSLWLAPLDSRQIPRFRYRWFWNWDNRMDWGGPGEPVTVMGGGTYRKLPEAFLIDCKRCVDYMADHKFNGLVLWGFLRDAHGGVEAGKELCRYASRRGVRILPGVGTSGYAGYYYQGKNEFNADTWLTQHPELRAVEKNGKPHAAPCPSKQANQDWLDRGAQWLFHEFQVGGANLEMGDFFVCYCNDCKRARAAIQSDEPDYYKDMAISHMVTLKTMRRLAPDAWLSYATYTGYTASMATRPPKFLAMIPDDAICQWTLTGMAPRWPVDMRPMARHNLGYLHWCNSSTHTEDDFYLEQVQAICRDAAGSGFEGLDTYGELSDERPNAELFYLAWEAFLWDPTMTVERFVDERLGRLYGGVQAARVVPEVARLVATRGRREQADNLAKARQLVRAARPIASADGRLHWDRLDAYLDRQEESMRAKRAEQARRMTAAKAGRKIAVRSVRASDEDVERKWFAAKAIDGNVDEPAGYWLTRRTTPKRAWLELSLAEPSRVNRVVLFHQLNAGHYRSLDYTVSVRQDGRWKPVVSVRNNQEPGWVVHEFEPITTDAVRLEITRSAHAARMGVGEMEVRLVE